MRKEKKIIPLALAGALVMGSAAVPASQVYAADAAVYSKNENVYVRMNQEGEVSGTYVVNSFTVEEEGEITDHGDYDSILNLTNLDEIEEDKDEYKFYAEEGKFFYQGNLDDAELPWKFRIRYLLDGKEVEPEKLAGAEGDLEIHMYVKENLSAENAEFFPAYLLQVSLTLDNDLCEDIVAEGASITDAGMDQRITFTVMPNDENVEGTSEEEYQEGENPEEEGTEAEPEETGEYRKLVVSASVTDFEMEDISINGVAMADFPVSFASDKNTMTRQSMFIMSAEGIAIPEEETEEVVEEEDNRNFIVKLVDKILNHEEE